MSAPVEGSLATGLSDDAGYLRVCREASADDRRFGEFRRDPEYTKVLEHVSEEQGAAYLEIIGRDAELPAMMPELCRNDRVGNPRTSIYEGLGEVSPTTLRYVKVLADLKRHFGTLEGLSICEIGPGYGGQCRLICACFAPASYQLVDLEPPLGLARRYLSSFEIATEVTFRTMADLEPRRFDLVISNYAFSELRRPVQDVYLDKVVLGAERGYITCNQITPPEFESYRPADLAALLPAARLVAEEPLTYPGNCILVWGSSAP
ncbi:MAG TPA: putative sugar O-methyltransferase [Thermoanaerobaculia bacterium]|nr:putative sugar O-methyltransferase [Thermoanaerobaculia bacterium]